MLVVVVVENYLLQLEVTWRAHVSRLSGSLGSAAIGEPLAKLIGPGLARPPSASDLSQCARPTDAKTLSPRATPRLRSGPESAPGTSGAERGGAPAGSGAREPWPWRAGLAKAEPGACLQLHRNCTRACT